MGLPIGSTLGLSSGPPKKARVRFGSPKTPSDRVQAWPSPSIHTSDNPSGFLKPLLPIVQWCDGLLFLTCPLYKWSTWGFSQQHGTLPRGWDEITVNISSFKNKVIYQVPHLFSTIRAQFHLSLVLCLSYTAITENSDFGFPTSPKLHWM